MNTNERLPEARLIAGLTDLAGPSTPGLHDDILAATARRRQRPAWSYPERWLPMAVITRPAVAPALRPLWLLLIALLMAALAVSGAIVGSRMLGITAPYPITQGGAAVLVFDTDAPGDPLPGDIYTVRADGTDLRQLTSGPAADLAPSWSPDGNQIAYRQWQDGTGSVVVMDAGGGNRMTLATNSEVSRRCIPWEPAAWSSSWKALVYPVSTGCDGSLDPQAPARPLPSDLYIVRTDGASPPVRLLAPGLNSFGAAWSPDGYRIAFVGTDESGGSGLYVVDVGTRGALAAGELQARRITTPDTSIHWLAPRWSPDGTQVAASAGATDNCSGTMDAFVVQADGSGQRSIAAETAKEYNPTWSPDGKRLAFQRIVEVAEQVNGRACTMATWVIDADGTNERRLDVLGTAFSQPPLWSPDGTRIVGNTVDVIDGVEHYDMTVEEVDDDTPIVTVDDVGIASWQPVAAPLPPPPSFPPA